MLDSDDSTGFALRLLDVKPYVTLVYIAHESYTAHQYDPHLCSGIVLKIWYLKLQN